MLDALRSSLALVVSIGVSACSSHDVTVSLTPTEQSPHWVTEAPRNERMTVMTYNLNFGMAGDAETIEVIRQAHADIVVLQETNDEWQRALEHELGKVYPFHRFQSPTSYVAGGVGLLSKYRFRERELVPSPNGWFPGWRVIADSPLGALQVLDVHLRPPLTDQKAFLSGYFSTRPLRRTEIETYAKTLDPELPTLVMGDFNEDEQGSAVRFLEERGMRSVLPDFQPGQRTWHWPTSFGEIATRLDHVVYDESHFIAIEAHVIEAGRSDHFPVVATFGLAASKRPLAFDAAPAPAASGPGP